MNLSEYKDMFKTESEEYLHQLNSSLLAMEQEPWNMEHINTMFRSAHTLKGMAATMGFDRITELTHEMENLMDRIKKNNPHLNNDVFDTLFECIDKLEALLESIDSGIEIDINPTKEKLGTIDKYLDQQETAQPIPTEEVVKETKTFELQFSDSEKESLKKADLENRSVMVAKVFLDDSCILKAARSSLVLHKIEQIGNIIATIPPIDNLEDESFDLDFSVVFSTDEGTETIKDSIEKTSEVREAVISPFHYEEKTTDRGQDIKTEAGRDTEGPSRKQDQVKSIQNIRVSIEKLDNLMNLVGELIINKSKLDRLALEEGSDELKDAIQDLKRLTNGIQNEVMEARMVPIEQIFSKFPRMIRDLARSEEKEIDLVMEGEDIKLDRTVLDEIGDPLVHILRNAVDHGIETKEERKRLGKLSNGTIRLLASRHHNNILIEIEDDGKGIDPANLRSIAFEKGLINKENAGKLSDNEILNFVFLQGFSSVRQITEISGRGVGMDVVKNKVEALGGNVKLASQTGKGTKISLQLPPTVAIIKALMVRIGSETYAIPVTNITKYTSMKKDQIRTINGEEVIMSQDELIPLLRMDSVLATDRKIEERDKLVIVIVERMENRVGLVVDELLGHQEIIIKPLDSKVTKKVKGFSGATILGNGSVALILDVSTLI